MILWIVAFVFMGVVGLVGFYQGAIRAAFSLVGLLVAAIVAGPLGGVLEPVIKLTGLKQPILLDFLGPVIAFLVVLIAFKSIALAVHRKVDAFYKYRDSDTKRLLFERLNGRVGVAVGVANGVVYFFLFCIAMHVLGYFTTQVRGSENEGIVTKLVSSVASDVQETRMTKSIAPFVPTDEAYYDAVDIVGEVFHNPLLQKRLSSYPVFVTLAERPEFKALAEDLKFQEFWLRQPRPSIGELLAHEKVKPLVENEGLFRDITQMLQGDLKDLKGYVETGKSAKYDEEKILGRWSFDYRESIALARRNKPNIGSAELRQLRRVLGGTLANATFTATINGQVILRTPSNTRATASEGSWKSAGGGKYSVTLNEAGKTFEIQAVVDGDKLIVTRDNYGMVFEK
ncbi:MAG: CvpA family protein [Verrucomicrobia subdivision 3 bacterium]|nr:CvpA family protein [Limisphaerales bacterium]